MSDTDKIMDLMNQGRLSPMPKNPPKDNPLQMVTLPDEKIRWFGKLDADIEMFGVGGGSSKYTTFDILVGASPYRLVFFHERGMIKSSFLSRSYWFDLDLEGQIWRHKKGLRRREYTSLHLAPPVYKKGLGSRKIIITNIATRTDGKQENIFECNLSSLKWLNPQTKKFEGGKADQLHQQIMEFYNQRLPVTFQVLCVLVADPDRLEDIFFATEPAEGQAIQVDAPVEKPKPAPKPAKRPVSAPAAKTCPSCGKSLHPDAKFCGGCGAQFGDKVEPVKAKPEPKPKTKSTHSKKSTKQESAPQLTVCPSCGKELHPDVKFCGGCGARFDKQKAKPTKSRKKTKPQTCAGCGKAIEKDWKACPYCGQSLSKSS